MNIVVANTACRLPVAWQPGQHKMSNVDKIQSTETSLKGSLHETIQLAQEEQVGLPTTPSEET
jgi:hypothetical protein